MIIFCFSCVWWVSFFYLYDNLLGGNAAVTIYVQFVDIYKTNIHSYNINLILVVCYMG